VTGLVAIWALMAAKNDSRERSRPVIVAEYRVPPYAYFALEFVVRNAGPSVARDIEVTFDPDLGTPLPEQKIRQYMIDRYSAPLPFLGPGQELSNMVHVDQRDQTSTDVPFEVTVKVRYRRSRWRWYEEEYLLKTAVYTSHTYQTSSDSPDGYLKAMRDALKKVAAQLEAIRKKD